MALQTVDAEADDESLLVYVHAEMESSAFVLADEEC
jgi:hypothetical protein